MKLRQQQKGASPLGWLLILLVVSFFGMCAFRIAPVYFDNRLIQSALQDLSNNESEIENMSDSDIRSQISKTFLINNLRNFSARDVKIKRPEGRVLVSMKYEIRVPVAFNIDAIMSFNNVWDSSRPYECCKPPRD